MKLLYFRLSFFDSLSLKDGLTDSLTGSLTDSLFRYRMQPLLSCFPSTCFYEQQLKDAPMAKELPKAWAFDHNLAVVPVFEEESPRGTSHMNEGEANVLAALKHFKETLKRVFKREFITKASFS